MRQSLSLPTYFLLVLLFATCTLYFAKKVNIHPSLIISLQDPSFHLPGFQCRSWRSICSCSLCPCSLRPCPCSLCPYPCSLRPCSCSLCSCSCSLQSPLQSSCLPRGATKGKRLLAFHVHIVNNGLLFLAGKYVTTPR